MVTNEIAPAETLSKAPINSSNHSLKIASLLIIGIFVIATSVAIGIQIGKAQSSSQNAIVVLPTPSPTQFIPSRSEIPIPNPSSNSNSSWNIYTSEVDQFTLNYPSSLKVGPTGGLFKTFTGPDYILSIGQVPNIHSLSDNSNFENIDEYIQISYQDATDKKTLLHENKEISTLKIQNTIRAVFFSSNKKFINIVDVSYDINKSEKLEEANKVFEQIISTIKFKY